MSPPPPLLPLHNRHKPLTHGSVRDEHACCINTTANWDKAITSEAHLPIYDYVLRNNVCLDNTVIRLAELLYNNWNHSAGKIKAVIQLSFRYSATVKLMPRHCICIQELSWLLNTPWSVTGCSQQRTDCVLSQRTSNLQSQTHIFTSSTWAMVHSQFSCFLECCKANCTQIAPARDCLNAISIMTKRHSIQTKKACLYPQVYVAQSNNELYN